MSDSAPLADPDRHFMQRALVLAAKGRGRVEPNPMVGCVIVKDGEVIGEGYHRRFGGPHAERNALSSCGREAEGADIYVTLEPCCHHGKTPPCTDALIAARPRRVVAAHGDPFAAVNGRGFELLRAAGIEVHVGLLKEQAEQLNRPFLTRLRLKRPYVIVKWAQSLDGRIATRSGDSRWISGEPARRWVHRLRGRVDAVIVGVGTVRTDDPQLTCRHGRPFRIATRVVMDSRLTIPASANLVRTAAQIPTLVITTRTAISENPAVVRRLTRAYVEVVACRAVKRRVDVSHILGLLCERGMTNVLVEGGSEVNGAFFDAGVVDEAFVFCAPMLIGGTGSFPAIGGQGVKKIADARKITLNPRRIGADLLFRFQLPPS